MRGEQDPVMRRTALGLSRPGLGFAAPPGWPWPGTQLWGALSSAVKLRGVALQHPMTGWFPTGVIIASQTPRQGWMLRKWECSLRTEMLTAPKPERRPGELASSSRRPGEPGTTGSPAPLPSAEPAGPSPTPTGGKQCQRRGEALCEPRRPQSPAPKG